MARDLPTPAELQRTLEICEKLNEGDFISDAAELAVYDHAVEVLPLYASALLRLRELMMEYPLTHLDNCPCSIGAPDEDCDCGLSKRLAELGISQ